MTAVASCSSDPSGGWTPEPQVVSSQQLAQLLESCPELQSEDPEEITAGVRGERALLAHGTPELFRFCVLDGVGTGDVRNAGHGSGRSTGDVATDEVRVLQWGANAQGRDGYSMMMGVVGEDVTGVEINVGAALPERLEAPDTMTATVEHGRFLGWWPQGRAADEDAFKVTLNLQLADGERVEQLEP